MAWEPRETTQTVKCPLRGSVLKHQITTVSQLCSLILSDILSRYQATGPGSEVKGFSLNLARFFGRLEGGLATFRKRDGQSRKVGFPDFRYVHVERERAELRLVCLFPWFSSLRRPSTGELPLSTRSHVVCVVDLTKKQDELTRSSKEHGKTLGRRSSAKSVKRSCGFCRAWTSILYGRQQLHPLFFYILSRYRA